VHHQSRAAAGEAPPDHEEVQRTAHATRERFTALLSGVLDAIAQEPRS